MYILISITKQIFLNELVVLKIADRYLSLILSSWPAVILILAIILLIRHKEAIDFFLRRINKVASLELSDGDIQKQPLPKIEGPEKDENNLDKVKEELEKEKLYRNFERIYSLIYGSQIDILQKLNIAYPGNLFISEIYNSYSSAVSIYQALKDYGFENYLSFLKSSELVNFNSPKLEEKINLTDKGKKFLSYLISEGLNLKKML